jgi:hypothetical protein
MICYMFLRYQFVQYCRDEIRMYLLFSMLSRKGMLSWNFSGYCCGNNSCVCWNSRRTACAAVSTAPTRSWCLRSARTHSPLALSVRYRTQLRHRVAGPGCTVGGSPPTRVWGALSCSMVISLMSVPGRFMLMQYESLRRRGCQQRQPLPPPAKPLNFVQFTIPSIKEL